MQSLSDEYIEKCYVDGNHQHNATEKALMIEHIASTSVPSLCVKPIIDILCVVEDAGKEEDYMITLCNNGYVLRIKEPDFENHHMFKGPDTDINLHIFSKGSQEIDKYLMLRNYLSTHEDARIIYANVKKEVARKTWKYVQNYADAKSEVIQLLLKQAMEDKKKSR